MLCSNVCLVTHLQTRTLPTKILSTDWQQRHQQQCRCWNELFTSLDFQGHVDLYFAVRLEALSWTLLLPPASLLVTFSMQPPWQQSFKSYLTILVDEHADLGVIGLRILHGQSLCGIDGKKQQYNGYSSCLPAASAFRGSLGLGYVRSWLQGVRVCPRGQRVSHGRNTSKIFTV